MHSQAVSLGQWRDTIRSFSLIEGTLERNIIPRICCRRRATCWNQKPYCSLGDMSNISQLTSISELRYMFSLWWSPILASFARVHELSTFAAPKTEDDAVLGSVLMRFIISNICLLCPLLICAFHYIIFVLNRGRIRALASLAACLQNPGACLVRILQCFLCFLRTFIRHTTFSGSNFGTAFPACRITGGAIYTTVKLSCN